MTAVEIAPLSVALFGGAAACVEALGNVRPDVPERVIVMVGP